MADSTRRQVSVRRVAPGRFEVANDRGGQITFGTGVDTDFTPTELLLAAIGGCTAIDVDILTSRRSHRTLSRWQSRPTRFATKRATG